MGSYITLFMPLWLSFSVPSLHIHRYSFSFSHCSWWCSLSGALSKVWNHILIRSCLISLQCFVMGLSLSDKSWDVYEWFSGVANIVGSTSICCAYSYRYMTFFVTQLKDCFGLGRFIRYLCLSDVLSANILVVYSTRCILYSISLWVFTSL